MRSQKSEGAIALVQEHFISKSALSGSGSRRPESSRLQTSREVCHRGVSPWLAQSAIAKVSEQKAHLIRGVGTGSFLKSQSSRHGTINRAPPRGYSARHVSLECGRTAASARITPSGLSGGQPSPYAFGIGQSSFGGLGRRARYAITFWFGSLQEHRPKGAAKRGASSRGSFRVTHCPRTLSGRKRNLSTHCPLKNEAGLLQRVPVSTDESTKQSLPHFLGGQCVASSLSINNHFWECFNWRSQVTGV